ncbi:MAG: hypothetical protein EOP01_01140 [Propionibacteriaceae bacterium]|nr:MAG: hypothetical protein EOP01_01140 [Propionibacteriaceae bacterium]
MIVENLASDEQLYVEVRRQGPGLGLHWRRHNTLPYLTLVAAKAEAEALYLAQPGRDVRVVRVTVTTDALGDL